MRLLLSPFFQGVLELHETRKVAFGINIVYFSRLYQSSKKCNIAGEVFSASLVIAAFWPTEYILIMQLRT